MKKIIPLLFTLFFALLTHAQVSKTVNLTAAGTLTASLTAIEKNTVTNLTINGTIDARDFEIMRDSMPLLAVLDISNVTISTYTGMNGTTSSTTQYLANSIPVNAFINMSNNVSKINLTSIILPNSVTSISDYAFYGCIGLTNLTIPNSVTSIGENTFYGCTGLSGSLKIGNSVTFIGVGAFGGCAKLTELVVQTDNSNYSTINGVMFDKSQACLIQYPSGEKGIYTIPNSVTSIGSAAFQVCTGLTGLTIPNSVTSIENYAFYGCSGLTSLSIPNSVTSIKSCAFQYCTGLISFTIPNSVTTIGYYAFSGCTGLTSIYANSTIPIVLSSSSSVFYNVNKTTCTLYVPVGSKSAYQSANQWKDFTNIVETTTAVQTLNKTILNVYPNPTTESFQISGIEGTALMTLSDLNGKTVLSKQITGNENVSVSSLSKGVYVLKITTNEGVMEKKIVKN